MLTEMRASVDLLCFLLILSFISLVYSLKTSKEDRRYPIVIVPGDGGSQMEAKLHKSKVKHSWCSKHTDDWFPLWLNLKLLTPYAINCITDNMRLVYDPHTHTTSNSPGVDIRIPGFGDTSTIEWLTESHFPRTDYFYKMVQYLVDTLGYERNVNIRGAPYDFRKAPNEMGEYVENLRKLVEDTYRMSNNTKVVLLGHSMGSFYILYMLNRQPKKWKDHFVKSFVSLAGPWGGAVKTLWAMASGQFVVYPLVTRAEQRSMTSSAWLLPYDTFWNSSEILIQAPSRNYTVNNYERFFKDINYTTGFMMRRDTEPLIKELLPPGVQVHCIHGNKLQTPEQLIYHPIKSSWYHRQHRPWYDQQPIVVHGDGDGTVNARSLEGCVRWSGHQSQSVSHVTLPRAEHQHIMRDHRVMQYLRHQVLGL